MSRRPLGGIFDVGNSRKSHWRATPGRSPAKFVQISCIANNCRARFDQCAGRIIVIKKPSVTTVSPKNAAVFRVTRSLRNFDVKFFCRSSDHLEHIRGALRNQKNNHKNAGRVLFGQTSEIKFVVGDNSERRFKRDFVSIGTLFKRIILEERTKRDPKRAAMCVFHIGYIRSERQKYSPIFVSSLHIHGTQ